jgi:hypothetical protein
VSDGAMGHRAACRHCRTRAANYPRGLCSRCWLDPAVRPLHGVIRDTLPRTGLATGNVQPPPPPGPCDCRPGSEGRVRTLEWRAESGFSLFHPDDRACRDD